MTASIPVLSRTDIHRYLLKMKLMLVQKLSSDLDLYADKGTQGKIATTVKT